MRLLILLSLVFSLHLFAKENSKKELATNYFKDLHSLSAKFVQSSTNPITNQLQFFSGRIDLEKKENASRFRFEYNPPHQQQVIGDSEHIWMIDFDLEQITRYKQNFMEIPLVRLLTNPQFEWMQSKRFNENQLNYFKVSSESQENELVLLFNNDDLKKVVSQDSLGNLVVFELSNVIKNGSMSNQLFEVNNPNNFDLIEIE